MSSYELSEILDIAQRELLCSTPFFSVTHHWQRYCEAFSHSERISFTPASLNSLRLRARQKRYQNDIRHARQYFTKRFPPLSLHESLLAYIRRAMSNQTTLMKVWKKRKTLRRPRHQRLQTRKWKRRMTPTSLWMTRQLQHYYLSLSTSRITSSKPLNCESQNLFQLGTNRQSSYLPDGKAFVVAS